MSLHYTELVLLVAAWLLAAPAMHYGQRAWNYAMCAPGATSVDQCRHYIQGTAAIPQIGGELASLYVLSFFFFLMVGIFVAIFELACAMVRQYWASRMANGTTHVLRNLDD